MYPAVWRVLACFSLGSLVFGKETSTAQDGLGYQRQCDRRKNGVGEDWKDGEEKEMGEGGRGEEQRERFLLHPDRQKSL